MDVLREHVGTVETETFIYYIRSQSFDYTRWQCDHYDAMMPDEIMKSVGKHSRNHPFTGKKAVVI